MSELQPQQPQRTKRKASAHDTRRTDEPPEGESSPTYGDYRRVVVHGRKMRKGSREVDSVTAASAGGETTGAIDRPEAYRLRRSRFDGEMTKLNGDFAVFCRDLQRMQMDALYPNGVAGNEEEEDKKDDGTDPLDAVVARADPNELDRIDDLLMLATKEYMRQASLLRARYIPEPAEVGIFGSNDSVQLGVGEDHVGDVIRPRLLPNLKSAGIIKIAVGGLHNVALGDDGSVYTWGSNDHGSLGRDGSEYVPVALAMDEAFPPPPGGRTGAAGAGGSSEVIVGVAAGDTQSLFVSLSGTVYMCGTYKDKEGKMYKDMVTALDADTDDERTLIDAVKGKHDGPVVVAGVDGVVDVQCGAAFNAALCGDGTVMTWGLNSSGELARGEVHDYVNEEKVYDYRTLVKHHLTPLPATFAGGLKRRVESIATGGYHVLVVTCPGQEGDGRAPCHPGRRVYAAGLNQYGQLGLGDVRDRDRLTRIEALDECNVRSVAAGQHHSLAVDGCGNVVSFGRGDYGQLGVTDGIPETGYFQTLPVYVRIPPAAGTDDGKKDGAPAAERDPVTHIACGDGHSLAITEGGSLYTWGFGESNALGHGKEKDEFRPRRLDVAKGLLGAGRKKEEERRRRIAELERREQAAEEAGEEVEMDEAVAAEEEDDEEEEEKDQKKTDDDISVKVLGASGGAQHTVILCSVTKKPKA